MQVRLRARVPGELEFGIIYGILAVAMLTAARLLPLPGLLPGCMFHRLTGHPCPTCGTTRAVTLLSRGDLLDAFFMNPLVTVLLLLALGAFAANLVVVLGSFRRPVLSFSRQEGNAVRIAAAVLLLLNWIYLLRSL